MCSENMQQIYRRTAIRQYDATVEFTLCHGSSPVNLQLIFRTHPYNNPSRGLLLIGGDLKRSQRLLVLLNIGLTNSNVQYCQIYHNQWH